MVLIGIIGGKGLMGEFFRKFFEKNGYSVLISDINTKCSNIDLAKKCDVVIISVPIDKSIGVIKEVRHFVRKDALLMDVTSLKSKQVHEMMKSECSVLGTHPMFGPTVKSVKGQTFVICKGKGDKWHRWIDNLLIKNGAVTKVTAPKVHDKFMSVIQGLIHFNSITIVHTMKKLGFNINESLDYTSPVYRITMDVLCRILNQDPRLYADIELENPEINNVLRDYIKSAQEMSKIVESRDKDAFIRYFKYASGYLGDFKSEAHKESDYLIEQLVKRKERKSR